MTEQIPGAITTSENESNTIEVADFTQGIKIDPNDLMSEDLFNLFDLAADERKERKALFSAFFHYI
jgi:hypothetical protein